MRARSRTRYLTLDFAVRTIMHLVTVVGVLLLTLLRSGQEIRLLSRHGDVLLNIILLQAHRAHMRKGSRLEILLASYLVPLRLMLLLRLLALALLLL